MRYPSPNPSRNEEQAIVLVGSDDRAIKFAASGKCGDIPRKFPEKYFEVTSPRMLEYNLL
jgi:hypothetical protein